MLRTKNPNNDVRKHLGITTMENDPGYSNPLRANISTMDDNPMKSALEKGWRKNALPMPSENPTILDFAQLALDVYDYDKDKQPESRKLLDYYNNHYFSKDWDYKTIHESEPPRGKYPKDFDPITGFYARIYENKRMKRNVIAIRGTSNKPDYEQDRKFTLGASIEQYKQAIDFVFRVKDKYNIKYITGHSLGGIVAKMIAPVTGLNVVAFNSSGVKNYLIDAEFRKVYNEWQKKAGSIANLGLGRPLEKEFLALSHEQKVLTYVVNNDEVGNFNILNDIGKHTFLSYGTAATKYNRQKNIESNIDSSNLANKTVASLGVSISSAIDSKELLSLHSMFHMYDYFFNNSFNVRNLEIEYHRAESW